jgi:cation diffusion facilitator family transporter
MREAPRHESLHDRRAEVRRVLVITLVANLAVVVAKAVVGLRFDTLSVVADAAHSAVDAFNNVLALFLANVAAQAPDERHPYGHAKFETLGALAAVAFFSITIFELVQSAVERLITGSPDPRGTAVVAAVMVLSALASGAISQYEARRGRALRSELLLADSAHTRADLFAALAVLAGLGLVSLGYGWADPAVTFVVAALIGAMGWRIVRSTVPVLVDERAVEEASIVHVALATPGVLQCYAVRSRGREGEVFAELTIAVDRGMDVGDAHAIADEVERRVAQAVGARDVNVHVEPADRP